MDTTALGDGLTVSRMGLGCMVLTGTYARPDPDEALATFHRAVERGVTFLDTADAYSAGANEAFLAPLLAPLRHRVVLATKFGLVNGAPADRAVDSRPERVTPCCDASLRRLGVDHVDLYYCHRIDRRVPIEETVGAMAALVHAGKVRHLGLCEVDGDELRRAFAVHPIAALQSEWSLWNRDVERDALGAARSLGVGIVPYGPLGRGALTGAITSQASLHPKDDRARDPRLTEHLERNLRLVAALGELADGLGATRAQVALAWLLAKGPDVVPIPGVERRAFLDENLGALDVALTDGDVARLDALFAPGAVEGDADGIHLRRR